MFLLGDSALAGAVLSHPEASCSESAPLGGQFKLELPDTIAAARRQREEKPEGAWPEFHPSRKGVAASPQEDEEQGGEEQDEDGDQDDEIMLI
jgi:hypothetical protein